MKKALVIFSGGQDSTTCLYWAIKEFGKENVSAIIFGYGQKHGIEIECAMKICQKEDIRFKIVSLSLLPEISESALTLHSDVTASRPDGLPATFTPNRNALFITVAHAWAQQIGATHLITGVCQTDYSGYPDCRQDFISSLEFALNIGSNQRIQIDTPLMYLTKAETFEMAKDLGVLDRVIEMTHTCYNGNREIKHEWGYGCGTCPACQLRAKGWERYREEYALHIPE